MKSQLIGLLYFIIDIEPSRTTLVYSVIFTLVYALVCSFSAAPVLYLLCGYVPLLWLQMKCTVYLYSGMYFLFLCADFGGSSTKKPHRFAKMLKMRRQGML